MENINKQGNKPVSGTISCDQVAWLLDIADRYLPKLRHPSISQEREMMKYAMLYEIMEILNLGFADDMARRNATPSPVKVYPCSGNKCSSPFTSDNE